MKLLRTTALAGDIKQVEWIFVSF